MVDVTPLIITLNFSQVSGAKDPSLANLPFPVFRITEQNTEITSNRDTRGYGNPFPTCINHSYKTKLLPEPSAMLSSKAYEKEPFSPNSLSFCFKAVGALLKYSSCSYKFEFPNSNLGANQVVYATGQNRPQLPCITTHHPDSGLLLPLTCTSHHSSANCRSNDGLTWSLSQLPLASYTAISSGLTRQAASESP